MALTALTSSESFIKALRAANDPPELGWPSKIDIAWLAWERTKLYIPTKSQVIGEWVLTSLTKTQSRCENSSNIPLLDSRYWLLLYQTLREYNVLHTRERQLNTLKRTQVIPLLVNLLNISASYPEKVTGHLSSVLKLVVSSIWPATLSSSPDALYECFISSINTLESISTFSRQNSKCLPSEYMEIILMVNVTMAKSVSNSSNIKRIRSRFLTDHLKPWLSNAFPSVVESNSNEHEHVLISLRNTGFEILYHLDFIKSSPLPRLLELCSDEMKMREILYEALPELFRFYMRRLKGIKSSVPGLATANKAFPDPDMLSVFSREYMENSSFHDGKSIQLAMWRAWTKILEIIESEAIHAHNSSQLFLIILTQAFQVLVDYSSDGASLSLSSLGAIHTNVEPDESSNLALKCIIIVTRLDYTHVQAHEALILQKLTELSMVREQVLEFMDLCLNYHVKTRTLPDFVCLLFACLQQTSSSSTMGSSGKTPFYHGPFESFMKSLRLFLTPGQCMPLLRFITEAGQNTFRKVMEQSTHISSITMDHTGSDIMPTMRLIGAIVSNFPINLLTRIDVEEVVLLIQNLSCTLMGHQIEVANQSSETVAAAVLHFHSAIQKSEFGRKACIPPSETVGKLIDELNILDITDGLLSYEYGHFYLQNYRKRPLTLHCVLSYIETQLSKVTPLNNRPLPDHSCRCDLPTAAFRLWVYLISQWLPTYDPQLPPEHYTDIARLLLKFGTECNICSEVVRSATLKMLDSAIFWETVNTKAALISLSLERMSLISCPSLVDIVNPALRPDNSASSSLELADYMSMISVLFRIPSGSFSRESRESLQEILLRMEGMMWQHLPARSNSLSNRVLLLDFTCNLARLGCSSEISSSEVLIHLTNEDRFSTFIPEDLRSSIVRLVKTILSGTVYSNLQHVESLQSLLFHLLQSVPRRIDDYSLLWVQTLHVFLQFKVNAYECWIFSQELQKLLIDTYGLLLDLVKTASCGGDSATFKVWFANVVTLLSSISVHVVSTSRYDLSSDIVVIEDILVKFTKDSLDNDLEKAIVNLILDRLALPTTDVMDKRLSRYLVVMMLLSKGNESKFNSLLSIRDLPERVYLYLLELTSEAAGNLEIGVDRFPGLLRFSASLLLSSRSGSAMASRVHLKAILESIRKVYAGKILCSHSPHFLVWVEEICTHKFTLLNLNEVGSIWSILSRLLSGSDEHSDETAGGIFELIVGIMRTLVWLRRDLVSATLPQFVNCLSRLFTVLTIPRADLGKRQNQMVRAKLPAWVNPSSPLGEREARLLSRFLTALKMKSSARNLTVNEEEKVESLAGPLLNHALPILVAYIKAIHDPLLYLSSAVRKALEPGLFTLCEIAPIHAREAAMAELTDAGEKATLKQIWQEFEKQKYVGQG